MLFPFGKSKKCSIFRRGVEGAAPYERNINYHFSSPSHLPLASFLALGYNGKNRKERSL